jgi:hypothetical protein
MALTITPAVSRRRQLQQARAGYVSGLVTGASASILGAVILVNAINLVVGRVLTILMACCVVVLAILRDLGLPTWVPYPDRQVREDLRDLLPPFAFGMDYGLELGFGFATRYTNAAHTAYALLMPIALLLLGVQGLIVALILFVVGKSLPLLGGAGASNFDSVQTRLALGNGQRLVWRWTPTLTAVAMVSLILWSGLK